MKGLCRIVELAKGYRVSIFSHDIASQFGPIACYSYLTDGLLASGQREMILTVSHDPAEVDPPTLPLQFFANINQLAMEGRLVDVGGYSEFGRVGFMGNFRGVLYEQSQAFADVPSSQDALAVILATEDELEVAKRCGSSRILVRLGDAYRYFPFPPWSDRTRSSVVTQDFWRQSILGKNLPRLGGGGTTVRREGERVIMRSTPRVALTADQMLSNLPRNTPIGVLARLDPEADGMLVWQPGQRAPAAIVPNGSKGERLGGCFIIIVGESPTNESERFEDGFTMKLTNISFATAIEAIRFGRPVSIRGAAGLPVFELSWMRAVAGDIDRNQASPPSVLH
jgi:hypothetical protein